MNWHILSTKLNFERKVAKSLRNKYEVYLPQHRLDDEQKGKVLHPLFPGYVFVRTTPEKLKEAARVTGVVNIVYYGDQYALVHEEDIKLMERFLNEYTLVQEDKIPVSSTEKGQLTDNLLFGTGGSTANVKRNLATLRLPALGTSLLAESKVLKDKILIGKAYVNNA
jgi:hypothetical protein